MKKVDIWLDKFFSNVLWKLNKKGLVPAYVRMSVAWLLLFSSVWLSFWIFFNPMENSPFLGIVAMILIVLSAIGILGYTVTPYTIARSGGYAEVYRENNLDIQRRIKKMLAWRPWCLTVMILSIPITLFISLTITSSILLLLCSLYLDTCSKYEVSETVDEVVR